MSNINLLCLEKKDILELSSDNQELSCPVECRYFNACADEFNIKKKSLAKQSKAKPSKLLDDSLPPENEKGDVENIDETGFQQSFEEDFIVEARKLKDSDEEPAIEQVKKETAKKLKAESKKQAPTKEPKPKKPSKPKNSRKAASLDDIEL